MASLDRTVRVWEEVEEEEEEEEEEKESELNKQTGEAEMKNVAAVDTAATDESETKDSDTDMPDGPQVNGITDHPPTSANGDTPNNGEHTNDDNSDGDATMD